MFNPKDFYDALPKRRAELIDGQFIVGGSLAKSAMAMSAIIRAHGPAILRELVPEELLHEALIEIFGKKRSGNLKADFSPARSTYPIGRLAAEIRLALFRTPGFTVLGGGTVIKLGEDAFMPDVYLLRHDREHRLYNYFLDGAPDLIIEVITPELLAHEQQVRLPRYAASGVPEVWWVNPVYKQFQPMVLERGAYRQAVWPDQWYESETNPGLQIQPSRLFLHDKLWLTFPEDLFHVEIPELQKTESLALLGDFPWPKSKFQPRLHLDPVAITFPEYASGQWEMKFEWLRGKAIFGGSEETTLEWLGLLLMTFGVKEGVRCLPEEAWGAGWR